MHCIERTKSYHPPLSVSRAPGAKRRCPTTQHRRGWPTSQPAYWPVLHLTIRLSRSSYKIGETVCIRVLILRSPKQDVKGRHQQIDPRSSYHTAPAVQQFPRANCPVPNALPGIRAGHLNPESTLASAVDVAVDSFGSVSLAVGG